MQEGRSNWIPYKTSLHGLYSNSEAKAVGGNIFLLYFNSIVMVPHILEFIAIVTCLC